MALQESLGIGPAIGAIGPGQARKLTGHRVDHARHAVGQPREELPERETTKTYTALAGEAEFHAAMAEMVLGADYPKARLSALQTVGGTGACRMAFELARMANPGTTISWYAMPAPSGSEDGESENPEYGSMLVGTGVFRYELNSEATHTDTGAKVLMRSTTAKLFDAGL